MAARPRSQSSTTPARATRAPSSERTAQAAGGSHLQTRAEICGEIRALQARKDDLRRITEQQKRETSEVEEDTNRLRASLQGLDLAEAELASDGTRRRCAIDVANVELEQLSFERRRLERELSAWHSDAARLRSAREERESRLAAEERSWLAERRTLEAELNSILAQVTAQEELLRSSSDADYWEGLPDSLAEQGQLQAALQRDLERMQADLNYTRSQRQSSQAVASQRAEADRRKLAEARLRLASETEVRKAQSLRLQAATSRLELLRQEAHEAISIGPRLVDTPLRPPTTRYPPQEPVAAPGQTLGVPLQGIHYY